MKKSAGWLKLLSGALLALLLVMIYALSVIAAVNGATGGDDVRIEYEVKLKLPLAQLETVWAWAQARYTDCTWLNQEGYIFSAAFGDEDFTDTYFDTPDLRMLAAQGGVRHRVRVVHSGPAARKDNRQLLQVKLDRSDGVGLARSEIKFQVPASGSGQSLDDAHPLLSLIMKSEREEFEAVFRALDIDPHTMQPILTLRQNRRRIYLSDQQGAFATLTFDLCSTTSWGADLQWAEIELELDENRYTGADDTERQRMGRVIRAIQSDLQQTFPAIEQDQTPKYNTAFARIEAAHWLPLRQWLQWRTHAADLVAVAMLCVVTVCSAVWYRGQRW